MKYIYTVILTLNNEYEGLKNFADKKEAIKYCLNAINEKVLFLYDNSKEYDFGIDGDLLWVENIDDSETYQYTIETTEYK